MKFQNILMIGCRDMDKKHKKCPRVFHNCDPPRFVLKNPALSFLYPYGAITLCGLCDIYRQTDGWTDKGDYIGPLKSKLGWGPK